MNENLKTFIKIMTLRSRVLKAMVSLSKPRIAILKYHSVQEKPDDYADSIGTGIIHSASAFESQMAIISREYNPVTLDDVLSFLLGEKRLPRKCVAVTFDDGFEDNFRVALPILEKYGIQAAFFVTVNSVENHSAPWFCRLKHAFSNIKANGLCRSRDGRKSDLSNPIENRKAFRQAAITCACLSEDEQCQAVAAIEKDLLVKTGLAGNGLMMTWDQIRQLRQRGQIVGSHSLTHPNLAYLKTAKLVREIAESKRILENKLKEPVVHFSYPGPILEPHFSKETVSLCEETGYKTAVTSTSGTILKGDNPLALKRVPAPSTDLEFRWMLENALLGRRL
jgi:peptidoglycan/xylan/chitin deacetylase (PgdA/CDA1 family)